MSRMFPTRCLTGKHFHLHSGWLYSSKCLWEDLCVSSTGTDEQTRVRAHAFPHGWKHTYMRGTPSPTECAEGPVQTGGHPCPRRLGSPSAVPPPTLASPCRGCSHVDTLCSAAAALGGRWADVVAGPPRKQGLQPPWQPGDTDQAEGLSPAQSCSQAEGPGPAQSCDWGRWPGRGSRARTELWLGTLTRQRVPGPHRAVPGDQVPPRSTSYQPRDPGQVTPPCRPCGHLIPEQTSPTCSPPSVPWRVHPAVEWPETPQHPNGGRGLPWRVGGAQGWAWSDRSSWRVKRPCRALPAARTALGGRWAASGSH